jgi:hypothetical protein
VTEHDLIYRETPGGWMLTCSCGWRRWDLPGLRAVIDAAREHVRDPEAEP